MLTRHITANVAANATASDGEPARFKVNPHRAYNISVAGNFGGGSVSILHPVPDAAGTLQFVEYTEGNAKTTAFGATFQATDNYIYFNVVGATSPALDIRIEAGPQIG